MYLAPKGHSIITDAYGIETHEDTAKCWHCQRLIFVAARADPNEFFCRQCMRPICRDCVEKPCEHWEARLDREEATDRWLQKRFAEKLEAASDENMERRLDIAIARELFWREISH